jgi:lysophospholipase L1-like esterase
MKQNYLNKDVLNRLILICLLAFLSISCKEEKTIMTENKQPQKHVLLLGASIGEAWDFPNLPVRTNHSGYKFEFIAKYEPDKSDILNQAIQRTENKPDVVIIKQCATYIRADVDTYDPKHVEEYKQLAQKWVGQLSEKKIVPIMATIVPISEEIPIWNKFKWLVKKYIFSKKIPPFYPNIRLKGISDYNDWVKAYSEKNGLTILDLEVPLHISDTNRFLKPELTTDGLHINKKAYQKLDQIVFPTLAKTL